MQFITTLRNAILSAISTALGAGGSLKIYTGLPAGAGNAATGTLLSTLTAVTLGSPSGGTMSLSATTDPSAAASGTPGYARLLTSGAAVEIELLAGVGTAGTTGTVTVSGGAVATCPLGTGGSGYPSGTYDLPCLVTGGGGNDAIITAHITGGAIASFNIVSGGENYATAPTVTPPGPFDLMFNQAISLNGTVTLTSGTFYAGNP